MNRRNKQLVTYCNVRHCLALAMLAVAMFIPTGGAIAQNHEMSDNKQTREEMRIHYHVAKTYIDRSYMDNETT